MFNFKNTSNTSLPLLSVWFKYEWYHGTMVQGITRPLLSRRGYPLHRPPLPHHPLLRRLLTPMAVGSKEDRPGDIRRSPPLFLSSPLRYRGAVSDALDVRGFRSVHSSIV